MPRLVERTAENLILRIRLRTGNGTLVTGLAHNTATLAVRYMRPSDTSWQTVSLVAGTIGTYTANSWKEIGGGWYQLCLPNAAIVPGERTDIEIAYSAHTPWADSIDAVLVSMHNVGVLGAGAGDYTFDVDVADDDLELIVGAVVTIQNDSGVIVRWGKTKGDGTVSFNLDEGDYTLLVSAGASYEAHSQEISISGNDSESVVMVPVELIEAAEPTTNAVYRLKTATDWILDLNIGSLQGVTWEELRFTLKAAVLDDADDEAALQVKLTNGGDASDGLVVLNAESEELTAAHATITVLDSVAGLIRVHIKAAATDALAPTDPQQWAVEETRVGLAKLWRRSETTRAFPWYHFDAKRLDGSGSAATIQASGVIIAMEAVTQHVAE